MRQQASFLAAVVMAALTYNVCKFPSEPAPPPFAAFEIAPVASEPDDDLTVALRQQARTAILDLQARRGAL